MNTTRRRFSAEFKFQVALDAAKGQQTTTELASKYEVHPNQISTWKRELLEGGATLFASNGGRGRQEREQEALQADLYEQIGRLKVELEWLKKSCPIRLRPSARCLSTIIPRSACVASAS